MATTNVIKYGTVLNLDGQLWQVLWFQGYYLNSPRSEHIFCKPQEEFFFIFVE